MLGATTKAMPVSIVLGAKAPLMTADRLLWAALGSIHAVGIAGAEERRMERVFGGEYRAYRSRVPKWLPIRYKEEEGDSDAA